MDKLYTKLQHQANTPPCQATHQTAPSNDTLHLPISHKSPPPQPAAGLVVEGTGGNTGVGLSMLCASLGYQCYCTMPNNVSVEKQLTMKAYGATIELCDTKFGVKDEGHYTQRAKTIAREVRLGKNQ